MKQFPRVVLLLMASVSLLAGKTLTNTDRSGVAIKGYDPVAYFMDGKAEKGDPRWSSTLGGGTYLFASATHKDSFDANPVKYEPEFGGFCAYGISRNSLVEIDPTAFQIVNGKLLLQYSEGILKKFNRDQDANLAKARGNWPLLLEKKGK